ncbi:MAG: AAA family ATPase [Bacteroidales bacterium]|nr:AAA family ATPase [Bacteroidales bacterium]
MKIQKLILENFRGFKGKHEIEFKPDVNVFVGINGAGKTTVLDALSFFLRCFIEEYSTPLTFEFSDKNSINIDSKTASLRVYSNSLAYDTIKFDENGSISFGLFGDTKKDVCQKDINNLPVFLYFNVNFKAPLLGVAKLSEIYKDALGINSTHFKNFFNWFNNEENIENEKRLNVDDKYRNPKLELIRKTVIKFSEEIKGFKFEKFRVHRDASDKAQFILEKGKNRLYFDMLSNGEKAIFYYVADIAKRLAIATPGNLNANKEGKGIVLIDEIDLHLHPSWQRKIIPALTKTFPNIQFFITTHSPQVLSNVKHDNIIVIEDFKIKKDIAHTLGRDTNSILYNIFNEEKRPEEYKQKINSIYELVDNDKITEAKKELDILKQDMGEDDVEINRIQMQIDLME